MARLVIAPMVFQVIHLCPMMSDCIQQSYVDVILYLTDYFHAKEIAVILHMMTSSMLPSATSECRRQCFGAV